MFLIWVMQTCRRWLFAHRLTGREASSQALLGVKISRVDRPSGSVKNESPRLT